MPVPATVKPVAWQRIAERSACLKLRRRRAEPHRIAEAREDTYPAVDRRAERNATGVTPSWVGAGSAPYPPLRKPPAGAFAPANPSQV